MKSEMKYVEFGKNVSYSQFYPRRVSNMHCIIHRSSPKRPGDVLALKWIYIPTPTESGNIIVLAAILPPKHERSATVKNVRPRRSITRTFISFTVSASTDILSYSVKMATIITQMPGCYVQCLVADKRHDCLF